MKLEKYKDKKETRKKVILISLTVITLVSITMVLYKTFANFRTSTSFPIMSGKVIYKKKGLELGKDIPTSSDSEGGLYEVIPTLDGWTQKEYRYGGKNPNNYVYFNCDNVQVENNTSCELWRIIGLVNVKTGENTVEQRIKIIRNESIGEYAWYDSSTKNNNWILSKLKNMLNDGYYFQNENVTCYKGSNGRSTSQSTCNFSSNPKGLTSKARDMIDNQVIWNLGGYNSSIIKTEEMYQNERGIIVYGGNATEWTENNDQTYHKGVGLIYASDYGYAVGGNVRDTCLEYTIWDFYQDNCKENDWLNMSDGREWSSKSL